ncbi:hypothetical protein NQ314_011019 [Rhamnusium bicolor]|uniref:GTF3C1 extended winged-helix domain-containing protein n=1 Tax=Rhamnusium bicolor TaxID=1586634 RepID=A0AAV8XN07_9CUCU|nr:hypothetical protein NQ314_011019 [Rhamnusium bicolor]
MQKKSEYMRKAQPVEKYIKCLELIDPYINIVASWCNIHDDSDDDSEDGKQGCSLMDVRKHVGIDNNTIRMVLKKLVAKNVVNIRKCDRGKQRHLIPTKITQQRSFKIKQRQRAGREMLKQETPAAKAVRLDKNVTSFPRMLEIEVPDLKYPCFIRDFSTTSFVLCEQYLKAEFNIPRSYLLKLSNKLIKSKETFNINQILSEIDSNLSLPQIKVNFDQSYTAKGNVNYITKLILLKAALGEVIINSETLNCLSRKRKLPMEMNFPKLSDNVDKGNEKSKIGDDKLQYMGDSPNVVFNEKDGDVCTKIIVSTPPTTFKDVGVYPRHRELSERVWSRLQIILNVIYEKKIFEDIYKMLKVIGEEEIKDGYQRKIDRKSLARLLKKLVEEGYIKVYKLVICDGKITKTQSFLCHPAVNHTDSLIKSACEQLKWKYFVGTHKKAVKPYMPSVQKDLEDNIQKQGFSPFKESDVMNSIAELKEMNKWKFMEVKTKYNRHIGRSYGFKPKFIRMRIVHEFLFYLIYGYSKKSVPLKNSEVEQLFKSYRIDLTREDLTKIPKMWCTEISWKMFIPPLPYHKGWIDGWALMCDIILRLPISVLCKIHNCPYELPELLEVLNHPIKRFYLVKDLSESIRNAVLFKRKYLFDINETMNRLAYCGLLQFGPQKYKEKDQIFIYLNRRASLLDTTTSEPAYHKISNKEYRQIAFFLNTQADVDSYWYNVYGLSLNTKLNAKQGGQLITLVDVSAKPELVRAITSKTPEQALEACQRRMKLHVASMYPNIEDTVSNLFRLEPILNYYSVLVNNLSREKTHDDKPFKLKEAQLSAAFVILMSYMVQHAEEIENILQGNLINVDHLTEENLHNIENNLIELEESPLKHEDAKDEDDVKKNVLKAVIHSSLGTKNEPGWAFQLFKIYQKYPDNLIRDAVGELKRTQAISFNRLMTKKDKVRWYTPFQLSNIYVFAQSTTFNDVTAVEAYNTYLNVKQNMKFLEFSQENIESKKYGQLLALNEFFSIWEKIQFKFYLPQSTVILNPHIKDHSELINELAVRLQTQMKKMIQESIETEQEPETETDNDRQTNLKSVDDLDTDITCNSPLDLNVDVGNSETINRLKTWVTDCMETKRERRSPSPEFINLEEEYSYQGVASASCGLKITEVVPENENCDAQVEKINKTTVKKPHNKEQVPTLEEIKEGMLKYTPTNEERQIPYITDLSSLLNKENFTELNTDEKTLERLKNHFIYQYALLEDFTLEEYEQLKDFYMIEYLEQSMRNKSIWDKIRCQMVVKDPGDISEVLELLVKEGGTQNDFKLAKEIIAFVYEKAVLGTKATEIKKHFRHLEQNCSLEVILKVLTDTKILLQAGICSITFVHYTYQSTWLIETFVLSCDEQKLLEEKTAKAQKEIKQNIEKHLQKTMKLSKHDELDQVVFYWFAQQRNQGIPLSGPIIQQKVLDFNKKYHHVISHSKLVLVDWINSKVVMELGSCLLKGKETD